LATAELNWYKPKGTDMRRILVLAIAAVAILLMSLGILEPHPSAARGANPIDAAPATIVGTWKVTYGSPAVVKIELTGANAYTMTAKTPVTLTGGSSCHLAIGTVIATFSGSGSSYTGRHGLWHRNDCLFAYWTTLSLTLNGNRVIETLGNGEAHTLARVPLAVTTNNRAKSWWWLWLLLLALIIVTIAYFIFRRKRQDGGVS
jgi:hypothetical protein